MMVSSCDPATNDIPVAEGHRFTGVFRFNVIYTLLHYRNY